MKRRFQRISRRSFAVGDNQQIILRSSVTECVVYFNNVRCRFETISRYDSAIKHNLGKLATYAVFINNNNSMILLII